MNTKPFRAILALFPLLATPALAEVAMPEAPPPSYGLAFSVLDPDRAVRDAVDPDVRDRLVQRVESDTVRGSVWTETMFSALTAVTAELNRLNDEGRLDAAGRKDVGALAAITVADTLVHVHPELGPALGALADLQGSPIEEICDCDKSGSRACGCDVREKGGDCVYDVLCPSFGRALCSTVNLEMCITKAVFGLFSPNSGVSRPEDTTRSSGARTRSR
jgi:hypothetical protein